MTGKRVHQLLKDYFGLTDFRPKQEDAITSILHGDDTLVLMPTGGGKSLCYQLPAIALEGVAIIISPLIALMKDQVDKLLSLGISARAINSSLTIDESKRVFDEVRLGDVKLLYVSPERLETRMFQELMNDIHVSFIAVDEAHCISEWGHDFRPSYRRITNFYHSFPDGRPPIIALTATATIDVRADIKEQLEIENTSEFITSFYRENIRYAVLNDTEKIQSVLNIISQVDGSAIVYTSSRQRCDDMSLRLREHGFAAESYHAGIQTNIRNSIQERFLFDKTKIIVATSAFGMGIDKPDVRAVIHYDIPATLEAYYQEAGRAGRDGNDSIAVLLYNTRDERTHEFLVGRNHPTEELLSLTYEIVWDFAGKSIGEEYEHTLRISENELLRRLAGRTTNLDRILEILEEAGYITIQELTKDNITSEITPRVTIESMQKFLLRTKDESQKAIIRSLIEQNAQGTLLINDDEFAAKLSLRRSEFIKAMRLLNTKDILKYYPLPSSRTYAKSISFRLLGKRLQVYELDLPIDKLAIRFEHIQQKLSATIEYATLWECRSKQLLKYFGERAESCGICDVCSRKKAL